jgi:hypothetical protein
MKNFAQYLLLLAGVLGSGPLQAQLLFEENFGYLPGTTIVGLRNWTAQGDNNLTVAEQSLSYPGLASSGGAAGVSTGNSTADVVTGITAVDGIVWVSMLVQQTNGPATWQGASVVFGDASQNTRLNNVLIEIGNRPEGTNPYQFRSGGSYGFFGNAQSFAFPLPSPGAKPALFLMKYDYGAVEITFYYNPDLALGEAGLVPVGVVNATTHGLTPFHMSLAAIRLRASNVISGDILFDEIRIGRTFAETTPAPAPE